MGGLSFMQSFEKFTFFPHNQSLEEECRRLFPVDIQPPIQQHSPQTAEEIWKEFRENGRDYEYCPEDKDTSPPRPKKKKKVPKECVFCRNNNKSDPSQGKEYKYHVLKDENGIVQCPYLRKYKCPLCGVNGDYAHTIKYCPIWPCLTDLYD